MLVAPSLTDNPDLSRQRAELKTLGITPDVDDAWLTGRFVRTFISYDVQLDFLRDSPVFAQMTIGMSAS